MALAEIKKIQLIVISQHKEKVLEILQNAGTLDVIEQSRSEAEAPLPPLDRGARGVDDSFQAKLKQTLQDLQKVNLTYADLEFTINLLSPYGEKRSPFAPPITSTIKEAEEKAKKFNHKEIVDRCSEIEEELTKASNALSSLSNDLLIYKPWEKLNIALENLAGTEEVKVIIGSLKSNAFGPAIEEIHKLSDLISSEVVERGAVDTYLFIISSNELEKEIRQVLSEYKFTEADFPEEKGLLKDYYESLEEKVKENKEIIKKLEKELKELAHNFDDLKIVYDYFGWQKEKLETDQKTENTEYNFAMTAWIPGRNIKKLKEDLEESTKEYEIIEIKPGEDETPPVIIRNSKFLSPFEAVSKIYGLPKYDELDPTPFLAAFFILFFALCLTDAGYGIVMFIAMAFILKKFKLSDGIKKLVRLLMYGGIMTFVIGAIFGGWFGLTADQAPEFLTYTAANGEKMFLLQKINAINNPIVVLILALSLGFIQVLTGVTIKFVHGLKSGNKKDAILDSGTWVFMLSGIGFFILAATGVLPTSLGVVGKWWIILAAIILVLTQGRKNKNIVLKFFSGILSLYRLIGYMSDVLSYSRILALGLATTIIGLAVNTVIGLVGGLPYIGWLLMAIVFIVGHLFNLLINSLGSFIHSGRLQFVEFFTKFMEGGGDEFKPFSKKSKYIYIKNNN